MVGQKMKSRYLEGFCVFGNAEPCSMCASACIKAKIFDFYFGAPHEDSMDPNISIFDIAKKSKNKINVQGNILARECINQIKKGRKEVAKKI